MRLTLGVILLAFGMGSAQEEFRLNVGQGTAGYFVRAPSAGSAEQAWVVVLGGGLDRDAARAALAEWGAACERRKWGILAPWLRSEGDWADGVVRLVAATLGDAPTRWPVDATRIYLVTHRGTTAAAFYLVSRAPHLVTAAVSLGGSPRQAIETNRLFAVNSRLVPLLWLVPENELQSLEEVTRKLRAAEFNFELRVVSAVEQERETVLNWLKEHKRSLHPARVDCETGNLEFGRCYWVEVVRFDPAQRNDVLEASRVPPGSGAYLALGNFTVRDPAQGAGAEVDWLPVNYRGPLKIGDRIVSLGGKPVENSRAFATMMEQMREGRPIAVIIQRGGERLRLETRVVLPTREENFTARVRAQWLAESGELLVVTRGIGALRFHLPPQWVPVVVNWNGEMTGKAEREGCWLLETGPKLRPCDHKSK